MELRLLLFSGELNYQLAGFLLPLLFVFIPVTISFAVDFFNLVLDYSTYYFQLLILPLSFSRRYSRRFIGSFTMRVSLCLRNWSWFTTGAISCLFQQLLFEADFSACCFSSFCLFVFCTVCCTVFFFISEAFQHFDVNLHFCYLLRRSGQRCAL